MEFGKVLTYRDVKEAKKLIGKKVVASNILMYIDDEKWGQTYNECCLEKIVGGAHSFLMSDGCFYQFIREVLPDKPTQPRYEPYNLSDKNVRDSLRARWYKVEDPDGTREEMVTRFLSPAFTKTWEVNGWTVEGFLKHCRWIDDGTPCGRRME